MLCDEEGCYPIVWAWVANKRLDIIEVVFIRSHERFSWNKNNSPGQERNDAMPKAAVIYHSRTGTTRKYAMAIRDYLRSKDVEVQLTSIKEYRKEMVEGVDYLLLGCWTSGLWLILQHPDKEWRAFAETLPELPHVKTGFFTTYAIRTGSMFRNMYKHVDDKMNPPLIKLQSRNGGLSEDDKRDLDRFISKS